jgi:hypothetical protein
MESGILTIVQDISRYWKQIGNKIQDIFLSPLFGVSQSIKKLPMLDWCALPPVPTLRLGICGRCDFCFTLIEGPLIEGVSRQPRDAGGVTNL